MTCTNAGSDGAALDLGHGVFGVLLRHDDGRAQPRLRLAPSIRAASRWPRSTGPRRNRGCAPPCPPRLSAISMPTSTPLASRCWRRIRSRSAPGGEPSSGNESTRMPPAIMRGNGSWPVRPWRKKVPNVASGRASAATGTGSSSAGVAPGGMDVAVHDLEPLAPPPAAVRHVHGTVSSLVAARWPAALLRRLAQARVGVERRCRPASCLIVSCVEPVGQDVLAVELPVRVVGREQQQAGRSRCARACAPAPPGSRPARRPAAA